MIIIILSSADRQLNRRPRNPNFVSPQSLVSWYSFHRSPGDDGLSRLKTLGKLKRAAQFPLTVDGAVYLVWHIAAAAALPVTMPSRRCLTLRSRYALLVAPRRLNLDLFSEGLF